MNKSTITLSVSEKQLKNGKLTPRSQQFRLVGLEAALDEQKLPAPSSDSPVRITFQGASTKDASGNEVKGKTRTLLMNDTHAVHYTRNQSTPEDRETFDTIWNLLSTNEGAEIQISEYEVKADKLPTKTRTAKVAAPKTILVL